MIAFALAALVATAPTPTSAPLPAPSPLSSPAPSQPSAAPVRVCVFKVSAQLRIDQIAESYGGGANALLPGATGSNHADGIITVNVLGKYMDGGLAIEVLEAWHNDPATLRFDGGVAADGTVAFPAGTINAVTRELLPYFATAFASAGALTAGAHWTVKQTDGQLVTTTMYSVTTADGDMVTIAKNQSVNAVEGVSVTGNVVYNSSLLLPISGQLRKRSTSMEADGQTTNTLDLRFDLISDSFQKP